MKEKGDKYPFLMGRLITPESRRVMVVRVVRVVRVVMIHVISLGSLSN